MNEHLCTITVTDDKYLITCTTCPWRKPESTMEDALIAMGSHKANAPLRKQLFFLSWDAVINGKYIIDDASMEDKIRYSRDFLEGLFIDMRDDRLTHDLPNKEDLWDQFVLAWVYLNFCIQTHRVKKSDQELALRHTRTFLRSFKMIFGSTL